MIIHARLKTKYIKNMPSVNAIIESITSTTSSMCFFIRKKGRGS